MRIEAGQEPLQHALTLGGTFVKQIHHVDQQKGLEPSGRRALSDDEVSDLPTRLQDAASYRDADVAAQCILSGPREKPQGSGPENVTLRDSSKVTEVPNDKKNGKVGPCMI